MSRWDGSSWVSTTLGTNALANFSANKITSGTIDASVVNVSNINAGNISTGYLAASRIQTGSLNANVITSNTITATQIAAGTITATEISSSYVYAGTISANNITTGTLSATVSLNAQSGTIGGWTLNSTQLYSGTGAYMNASNGNIGGSTITAFTGILSYGSINTTSGASIESAGLLHAAGNLQVDTTSTITYSSSTYNIALIGVSSPAAIGRFYKTTSVSSRRFKHNIQPFIERDYLNIINKISPVTFNYNADIVENPDVTAYGLIAEDVQAVPQTDDLVILGADNQPEAIAYDRLNWYVIKAIQQLSNKVDAIQKEGK
jgi:hypothetical protein